MNLALTPDERRLLGLLLALLALAALGTLRFRGSGAGEGARAQGRTAAGVVGEAGW